MSAQLFPLGLIVATPGALDALAEAGSNGFKYLVRHAKGDCGELSEEDKRENELSVRQGFRILGAYTLKTGVKLCVFDKLKGALMHIW